MTLRILYLGNYRHEFCTEVHIARELEALGHTVDRMQEPPGGGNARTLELLERRGRTADLVLWTRTWSLPPEASEVWRNLEARGVTTASYHLDLYLGLQREDTIATDPFWTTQHVFTPDGNSESETRFASLGINHHWSPPGVVRDECADVMPGRYREEFAHDIVFVGSYGYHDEHPRQALIDRLADRYGDRFRRYGGDTTPGPIRGQDLNDLYASCKVVVGDSCFASRGTRYWSDRFAETWGRGGFLIHPQIDAIADDVGLGLGYPSYPAGDWDALGAAVDAWIDDAYARDTARERIGAAVAERCTYRVRLARALETMGLT